MAVCGVVRTINSSKFGVVVSICRRSFSPQFQNLCSVSLGRLKVAEDNNSVSVNKTSKPYIT